MFLFLRIQNVSKILLLNKSWPCDEAYFKENLFSNFLVIIIKDEIQRALDK
jgi:hypothetical protein